MTDSPPVAPCPPARPSRGPQGVLWLSGILFLACLAVLAARLRAGEDPALRAIHASAAQAPRHVLLRRIVERRVVVHLPASEPAPTSSASQQVGATGAFSSSAPITRTS
jgi:hypothetical protein